MKIALAAVLSLVVIFMGVQIFDFIREENALNGNLTDVQTKLAQAQVQEADLEAQTQYLSNPANLEKELRAQFNYKKPGETMIIIVPPQTPSSTP